MPKGYNEESFTNLFPFTIYFIIYLHMLLKFLYIYFNNLWNYYLQTCVRLSKCICKIITQKGY